MVVRSGEDRAIVIVIVIDIRQVATEQPTVPFGRYGRREVDVNDVDRRPENVRIELDAARLFCATALLIPTTRVKNVV